MSIEFKSNPVFDIVIFSGIDIKYETQLSNSNLIGDAKTRALEELSRSYKAHKSGLNLKYGQFLRTFEENIAQFNNPKIKSAIATKLSELAKKRIEVKESQFSGIHKFFHKIGQYFKGHGFRTKGEWGIELASRIKKDHPYNEL